MDIRKNLFKKQYVPTPAHIEKLSSKQLNVNDTNWEEEIRKYLFDKHPYLQNLNFTLVISKKEGSTLYGMLKSMPMDETDISSVIIPVIVKNGELQEFDMFQFDNKMFPLNKKFYEEISSEEEVARVADMKNESFRELDDIGRESFFNNRRQPIFRGGTEGYTMLKNASISSDRLNELPAEIIEKLSSDKTYKPAVENVKNKCIEKTASEDNRSVNRFKHNEPATHRLEKTGFDSYALFSKTLSGVEKLSSFSYKEAKNWIEKNSADDCGAILKNLESGLERFYIFPAHRKNSACAMVKEDIESNIPAEEAKFFSVVLPEQIYLDRPDTLKHRLVRRYKAYTFGGEQMRDHMYIGSDFYFFSDKLYNPRMKENTIVDLNKVINAKKKTFSIAENLKNKKISIIISEDEVFEPFTISGETIEFSDGS